uniref:Uncharacterized protein n=1 Tax=Chromera velia CCMP2878 TaxID=1169474 RepID=A0A0G4I9C7_9ALVE|eukprot:Cvel_12226.t1-p1 / transcript=Cvel_12226.t1 / gene=Cvel_12226 / organism=Chromera_velia_CCMP2878 / gene_product=hypothetical protein / transcript_product=hypothetical protein / location=Cvel_scaffold791:48022-48324(+) / protein_length=101 / sequence_SO=supercontig / SO=protein_coding / is_pseudo=false
MAITVFDDLFAKHSIQVTESQAQQVIKASCDLTGGGLASPAKVLWLLDLVCSEERVRRARRGRPSPSPSSSSSSASSSQPAAAAGGDSGLSKEAIQAVLDR